MKVTLFPGMVFQEGVLFLGGLGLGDWGPMDAGALRAVLRARIGLLLTV